MMQRLSDSTLGLLLMLVLGVLLVVSLVAIYSNLRRYLKGEWVHAISLNNFRYRAVGTAGAPASRGTYRGRLVQIGIDPFPPVWGARFDPGRGIVVEARVKCPLNWTLTLLVGPRWFDTLEHGLHRPETGDPAFDQQVLANGFPVPFQREVLDDLRLHSAAERVPQMFVEMRRGKILLVRPLVETDTQRLQLLLDVICDLAEAVEDVRRARVPMRLQGPPVVR